MTRRIHANNCSTTLDGAITNVATTLTVVDSTGFPALAAGETFRATLQSGSTIEIVEITNAASDPTFTVTRGMEGTTAVAWVDGSTFSIRATADSMDRKQDQIANSSDVIDFGAATSLEIPNSATPAITVSGQVALDTTVTDYADGVVCYQAGSTIYGVVAVPLTDLASPTDTYAVTYDAATDKFKLAAGGAGYTDEQAQDAIGAMIDTSLVYADATPLLQRAALTGDVTASAGSNTTTVALPSSATVATDDKVYIFDTSASDAKKYITAQSIANLARDNTIFRAYRGTNQTISDSVATKVQFATETFDLSSWYDGATNYRFTPLIAGKFQINFNILFTGMASGVLVNAFIYKNGAAGPGGSLLYTSGSYAAIYVSDIVEFNGSTDYVEIYVTQFSGGGTAKDLLGGSSYNYLSATLI